jgi:hypothetical protein
MVLRILGVVLVIWIAVSLLGALFQFLTWALMIGAAVFLVAVAYSALKSHDRRSLGR